MSWPLHEYDPRPAHRRARRAWLVLLEHLTREITPPLARLARLITTGYQRVTKSRDE